jgi:DNA-binding FadR family transcriptional regulator
MSRVEPKIAEAKQMSDRKSKKPPAARKTQKADRPPAMRRADVPRMTGTSVHLSLASEIGLRIVRGDYPPGTILPNEAQWSQTFDVSRSAVREATKMLMAKSLLASRPKVGSWVEPRERWNLLDRDVLSWYAASPDREAFLRTLQEFRHIIEPEAAALAAVRRDADQMRDISRALNDMGSAASFQQRTEADTRFHVAILRASGNELLVPLGVAIESALEHLFLHVTRRHTSQEFAQKLHSDIERCIRLQRPNAARQAVRKLLANTDEIIRRT